MNGEKIFRALAATKEDVIGLAMSWTKADTARVMSALTMGTYRLLPRELRNLLDKVAEGMAGE